MEDTSAKVLILEIPPASIVMLHAIVEGYDGLAMLRTVDERRGLVAAIVPKTRAEEFLDLLRGIAAEIPSELRANIFSEEQIFDYRRDVQNQSDHIAH